MRLESCVCRSDGLQRVEDGEARWLPAHAARYEDDEAQQERVACDVRIRVPVLPEPGGKRQVLGVQDGADVDGQEREEREPRTRAPVRARACGDEARVRGCATFSTRRGSVPWGVIVAIESASACATYMRHT